MISLDTIEREIRELEARGETTYAQCERLAWLYICRDHLLPPAGGRGTTGMLEGSEFLEAVSGLPYEAAMRVLDEHMEALKVVNRRAYDGVMGKLAALA